MNLLLDLLYLLSDLPIRIHHVAHPGCRSKKTQLIIGVHYLTRYPFILTFQFANNGEEELIIQCCQERKLVAEKGVGQNEKGIAVLQG